MFNQKTQVPRTDEEVKVALQRNDDLLTGILIDIYECRRGLGEDVLTAYLETLLAHAATFTRQPADAAADAAANAYHAMTGE